MTIADLSIKRGDTVPALMIRLADGAGDPVNLTGATVRVIGWRDGEVVINDAEPSKSTTEAGTIVTHEWTAEETAVLGRIYAEVEVTYDDASVQTFPADGFLTIEVVPDLG